MTSPGLSAAGSPTAGSSPNRDTLAAAQARLGHIDWAARSTGSPKSDFSRGLGSSPPARGPPHIGPRDALVRENESLFFQLQHTNAELYDARAQLLALTATREADHHSASGAKESLRLQVESLQAELGATTDAALLTEQRMQAALDAAAPAAMMDGPGAAEVQQLAMEIASRLSTDENLRRSVNLRRSQNVRAKVRRMWDLMVVESAAIALEAEPEASAAGYKMGADGPLEGIRSAPSGSPRGAEPAASQEGEVTKGGYKLLHMRVAKVLTAPQLYNLSEANDDAEAEWDADVARFLGTSHIMVWLDTIRTQFHTASKKAVMEHGFDALFK